MDCSNNYSTLIPYLASFTKRLWPSTPSKEVEKENIENIENFSDSLNFSVASSVDEDWDNHDEQLDVDSLDLSFVAQQKQIEESLVKKVPTCDGTVTTACGDELFDVQNVDLAFINQQKWIEKQLQSPPMQKGPQRKASSEKKAKTSKKVITPTVSKTPPAKNNRIDNINNGQSKITSFFFRNNYPT